MKSFTSWLLIAVLVGLLTKNVLSFPAQRAVDLSSDVLAEDTDAEDGDDDDTKSDDNKRVEIAKEGSGIDASKKTAVEQGKEEEEEEEDDSPDTESDIGSGSGEVQKEDSAEEESNDDNAETTDGKTKLTRNEISKDDDADDEDLDNGDEKAEEHSTGTIETDSDEDNSVKKDGIAEAEESEETEEDNNYGKRTDVAKRDGCCCGDHCGDHCHHCHEHEGGCHEGCCCGHEAGHHHGHHEHEDCCHHHGHHHGFVHEWGQECCGEHHGHECCGHHEQGHHHEGEHEHDCCHHGDCCHHEEGGGGDGGGGYGWGRSNVPVGYHCHDMVSKSGKEKTKRFCVPVYSLLEASRNTIERPNVKKQTVHVGYGYASGDNYRLGYQQGGMGGLASSFTGQVEAGNPDGGGNEHFNKRSLVKRNYDGHGYGSFNSGSMHGSATPYGHPVTHPGFTTMGFPGHALASQDVRHNVPHPMIKREAYEEEPENLIQNQMRIDDVLPSVEQGQGMSFQYGTDEIEG